MIDNSAITIDKVLLSIVNHKDLPEVILIIIDTTYNGSSEIVPYLNIYGFKVSDRYNFDESFGSAVDHDDLGFLYDALTDITSSEFEIELSKHYPNWPDNLKAGDKQILNEIQKVIADAPQHFNKIKKLYFDHIDRFGFIKLIDR